MMKTRSTRRTLTTLLMPFIWLGLLICLTGAASAQTLATGANAVFDSFTGTAGQTLDQHTGETGAAWTHNTSQSSTLSLFAGGYLQPTTNSGATGVYLASGSPAGTDYDVFAPLVCLSAGAPVTGFYLIGHAAGTTTLTGYLAGFDGNNANVEIYRFGSSAALVGTPVALNRAQGETYTPRVAFRTSGGVLTVSLGVQRASDGDWYTAGGAWQAAQAWCVSYADASPLTGTQTGVWMGAGQAQLQADSFTAQNVGPPPLSVGTLSAISTPSSITLAVSSPLSGGSGTGYGYKVWRDTQPNVSTAAPPYAAVSSLPYTDSAGVAANTDYYYKVVGADSAGTTTGAVPGALTGATGPLSVAARLTGQTLGIVFEGNSITAGAKAGPGVGPGASVQTELSARAGVRSVLIYNAAVPSTSLVEAAPSTAQYKQGASSVAADNSDAYQFMQANPTGLLVFSDMWGTNESAVAGYANGNKTKAQFKALQKAEIDQHLADWPNSVTVLHYDTYYTPNAVTSYTYGEAGLALVQQYNAALSELAASYAATNPGHVFVGDKLAYSFMAANYAADLTPENGSNGVFYLHPNAQGNIDLGKFWATGIYNALYGAAPKLIRRIN